jgi:hypothetical protein
MSDAETNQNAEDAAMEAAVINALVAIYVILYIAAMFGVHTGMVLR